jgi:hypothetical protein
MSKSAQNKASKNRSVLKTVFNTAVIGAALAITPLIAFDIERALVESDLETTKRAEFAKVPGMSKSLSECMVQRSVTHHARAVVYQRWADRIHLIDPLSSHFEEKAEKFYKRGTKDGADCMYAYLADQLEGLDKALENFTREMDSRTKGQNKSPAPGR